MKYCSECGAPVARKKQEPDLRERMVCTGCNLVHFENPRVLVICLAHWDGRLVMCRRRHDPAAGLWISPGGFVENGETLQAAAARELAEEAGVIVDPVELIPYSIASMPYLCEIYISFRVHISKPTLRAGEESLEVGLFSEADMPWDRIAFSGPDNWFRQFFEELRSGKFSLHLSEFSNETRTRRSFPMEVAKG
jgi:NADH pyrophosphatase NudC (nudix superfamily)